MLRSIFKSKPKQNIKLHKEAVYIMAKMLTTVNNTVETDDGSCLDKQYNKVLQPARFAYAFGLLTEIYIISPKGAEAYAHKNKIMVAIASTQDHFKPEIVAIIRKKIARLYDPMI